MNWTVPARLCAPTARLYLAGLLILLASNGCRYNPSDIADLLMRERVDALIDSLETAHPGSVFGVFAGDTSTGWRYSRAGDRVFHAASTMKVPVMIEVYRRVEEGRMHLSDSIEIANEFSSIVDGSPYSMSVSDDSDDSIYGHIGRRMSVRDLVFQMITVSSNLATNLLIEELSADSVQATIDAFGVTTMRVLRGVEDIKAYEAGLSNTATANDLGRIMERIAARTAVSESADDAMLEVLAAQRFNEMIPAGLPEGAVVAHKTGSITRINHDAAVVNPDDNPYVLVILTEGIDDHAVSAAAGAEITRLIHGIVRPGT